MAGPHQNQRVGTGGADVEDAAAAVVLVHGRGATARSILQLAAEVNQPDIAYLAPQAAGNSWYPNSFLAPVASNEPGRSSGLHAIGDAVETATDAGIDRDRVALVGFSQGACLACEFVARMPRRYGGLAALSGGLIGPEIEPSDYEGSVDGMPVFLGCSDVDPHIPAERVHETARVFERLDAAVTKRLYEGMGHGINDDELQFVSSMITDLTPAP